MSLKYNAILRLDHATSAVVERLEDRRLMAGDASVVNTLPYSLDFSSLAGGMNDKDGEATGFSWVQPNRLGTEYQANLIDLDRTNGVLKLTTTGTSAAGGPWEADNTLVNGLQTQFNAATGSFTVAVRLIGPLGFLSSPSQQGGLSFGPDQDNYIKLVAAAQPNGQFLQFVDEQKTGSTFFHAINTNNSYTSIGSFANVQTLDLMIAGNASTGLITGFYSVNGGALQQVSQSVTLSGTQKSAFFATTARAGLIAMAKNDLAPVTVKFDNFSIINGTPQLARPSVNGAATRPADSSTDVQRDAFVSAAVNLPNLGKGVDPKTLNTTTVLLYRTSDRAIVSGHVSTSGAGDTITYQPNGPLDANTQYTFEVTSGVKDISGSTFLPFKSTFSTGTRITAVDPNIAFEQVSLPSATGQVYTAVTVGPDHKLYAATLNGLIQRFNILADGTLGPAQNINTVTTAAGASRTITGLTFDPTSTATNLILWIANNQYAEANATDWTGKITRLWGPNLENIQDYVTGLPRSVRDHMTNQIAFGPDGGMYFMQSSNSSMGAPDSAWGGRSEHLLNAAVLRLNVAAIDTRVAAGQGPLNVQTEGLGANNYNPFAAGAPLIIYATGVRNGYDLVWTRSGYLFTSVNGSAAGGNTPAFPNSTFSNQRIDGTTWTTNVPALGNVTQTEDDFLFKITQGGYYGHPNATRGEYVLDGGNPTGGTDYEEFSAYPVGTQPDYNYRAAAYVFGTSHSPDGMIEYQGNAFGGALDGTLMVVRYSGGADVMVLTPDANGNITKADTNIAGLTGFINPVDIAEDTTTGYVYVADYGAQKLLLARPIVPGARATPSKSTLYFNDDYASNNTVAGKTQTLRITNTGTQPLSIPATGLVLSDTTNWVLVSKPTLPAVVPVGGFVDIGVAFKAVSAGGAGIRTATLTVTTNDLTQSNLVINLRGLATVGTGGQLEPSLQRILDLYQIPIVTGDINPSNTNLFSPTEQLASINDEINAQRLIKAGSGSVTIEPISTFAGGSPAVRFGYYDAGTPDNKTELLTVATADAQTVNPTLIGVTSFDPGSKSFGLYANFPIFANTAYSEDVLNTKENTVANQRKVRFYPLKDASGNVVSNAYVFATEDYVNDPTAAANGNPGGAYDTNDFVGIIRNVAIAPAGGEIGLQNLDGTQFPDRLIFNRIQIQPPDLKHNPDGTTTQPPNNVVHDTSVLRLRNTGNAPLTINSLVLSNNGWTIVNPPAAGTQIAAGGFLDITVKFVATTRQSGQTGNQTNGPYATGGGTWNGTLTINSDDADEPATAVQLAGYWQSRSEFDNEPNLVTQINNIYGYKTNVLSTGQVLGAGTLKGQIAAAGEEVLSPYWLRADGNLPITVSQLSAYHTQGNSAAVYWTNKGTGAVNWLYSSSGPDGQTLLPHNLGNTAATATFNPSVSASNPDGAFGFRIDGEWSDDSKNYGVAGNPDDVGHHVRFFPARDRNGNIIANTWLMAMDYAGINYDYQDNLYLISNMRPLTPTAPTGLTATSSGPGIQLAWVPPSATQNRNVSGYNVYRSTTAAGTYTRLNSTPVTSASYVDGSATPGTAYYYKVTAADSWGGESPLSSSATATRAADAVPPAIPAGLAAQGSATGIQLNWTANTEADLAGYKIYRASGVDGTFLALNSGTTVTTASFLDGSAAAGTRWFYKITAVDTSGNESALSSSADAIRQDTTPPAVPTGLAANGSSGTSIVLSWTGVGDSDLAGYKVYRAASASGPFTVLNSGATISTVTFTDSAVAAGQTWYYQVTSIDTTGNESAASTVASASIPAPGSVTIRINAGGGNYTDSNGVAWQSDSTFTSTGTISNGAYDVLNTTDDALYYQRRYGTMSYRLNAPDGTYTLRLHFADPIYTTAGKRNFSVKANNTTILSNFDIAGQGGGQKPLIKTFNVTLTGGAGLTLSFIKGTLDNPIISAIELIGSTGPDSTAPAAPASLAGTGSSAGVALSWLANSESDLAGYNVYRSNSAGGTYTKLNTSALVTGTSYNNAGAAAGTWYYKVTAVDASGNESVAALVSATVPATPDTTPPAAPTGVTASGSALGNSLAWTANTENDLAGYYVYRSSLANGTYVKLNTTLLASAHFADTSAQSGATSYYRIVAVDTTGNASAVTQVSAFRPA